MKKLKAVLIIILLISVIGGLSIFTYVQNRVPQNPTGTVGNTAGNLYNNGLFCEDEGKVYFSNSYDANTLYVMNPDETEIEKISTIGASSINAANKYVYFYQGTTADGSGLGYTVKTTGIYRMTKDGKDSICLKREPVGILTLINNSIYFQYYLNTGGLNLSQISIDKENEAVALDGIVYPACVVNNVIYYSNPADNFALYSYDTISGFNSMLWNHRVWNPIYHTDGYIYFMDIDTEYELHRYHPSTGEHQTLTTDRLEGFNVYDNYIYYQKFSQFEPMLMRMYTDGSNPEIVAYGNFENINITSQYVYYNEYNAPTPIYHQALYGPVNPTIFAP